MRSINLRTAAAMVVLSLLPAAAAAQAAPSALPSAGGMTVSMPPSPLPSAVQTGATIAVPTVPPPAPALSAPPAPQSMTTPIPSPYHYSFNPPQPTVNAPRIIEIDLTDKIVRPGLMQLRVLADNSVTSVTLRAMGRTMDVPETSVGVFAAQSTVPSIPFFVRGRTIWVDVVAARQDGTQTVVSLPVTLS